MQLIRSEQNTSTTTDINFNIFLINVFSEQLIHNIKSRRFIVELKYEITKYEKLNLDIVQQILQLEPQFQSQVLYELSRVSQNREPIPIKSTSNITPEATRFEKQGIEIVHERLIELLQEEDEDEYGVLKPTTHAFNTAWVLVSGASELLKKSFPKASASTDDKGGVRLTWTRLEPEREIRLVCPSDKSKKTYLYHESSNKHGIIEDVTALTLAGWLQWFNNA